MLRGTDSNSIGVPSDVITRTVPPLASALKDLEDDAVRALA